MDGDIFIPPGNGRYYLLSRESNLARCNRCIVRNHWPFGCFVVFSQNMRRRRSTSSFGWDGRTDGWMIGGVSLRTPLFHRIIIGIVFLLLSFVPRIVIISGLTANCRSAVNYATENDVADFWGAPFLPSSLL